MFTEQLYKIQNHKGIQGQCSYAIWGGDNSRTMLYAFDAIGGESVVKAVFASVFGRSGRLELKVKRYKPGQVYIDDALGGYRCHKEVLVQQPTLYRWHVYPEPHPDDPYLIFFDFQGDAERPVHQSAENACYQVLEQHTIWPARQVWAATLFRRGREAGLIRPLNHTDNLAYAYVLARTGWDEILDQAVTCNNLPLPR